MTTHMMKKFFALIAIVAMGPTVRAQIHTSSGMLILGSGYEMRAVAPYKSNATALSRYAETAKAYAKAFGDSVAVYCMPIPTSGEYYGEDPDNLPYCGRTAMEHCFQLLGSDAVAVNVWQTLRDHVAEPIYSRTDHHWQPLGAYYAAEKFAEVAGVPFRSLADYDTCYVHRFVGTMPRYAKYPALRNYPEDLVYYKPRGVDYSVTFIEYQYNKQNVVTGEAPEAPGEIFRHYDDGKSGAYCTFLGGDPKVTNIKTSTHNGRRLLILKDSFGNALPAFLLFSFEQICVVDCRYFTKNIIDYARGEGITDILFANNLGHAGMPRTNDMYLNYLTQKKKQ